MLMDHGIPGFEKKFLRTLKARAICKVFPSRALCVARRRSTGMMFRKTSFVETTAEEQTWRLRLKILTTRSQVSL